MKDAKLNSPINAPRMQADRDKQAKGSLTKGGKGQVAKAQATLKASNKAERDSYKLNRKRF